MSKSIPVPSLSARVLHLAGSIAEKRNAFLAAKNLQPGQDHFLLALNEANGITMGALAEKTGNSASSTTKIATRLEAEGLVRRETSRVDSRQNHAFLTDKGKALAEEIVGAFQALDAELVSRARPKDVDRGFKLFDRLETDPSSAAKTPKKAGGGKKKSGGKKGKSEKGKKQKS